MIKDKFKKNIIIVMIYRNFRKIISTISPIWASKVFYWVAFGERLDLKNPKTFNEKLQWLKLNTYNNNSIVTQCADKYRVREYVKSKGCGEIINELIGVWNSVDEINWSFLPEKFAIKYNHGCKYNIICDDKSKLNIESAKQKLKKWRKNDGWRTYAEVNYKYIPKKIICEKYLNDGSGFLPEDYKFYCFDGKAKYVMICVGREKGKPKFYFFDRNWKFVKLNKISKDLPDDFSIHKPKGMDTMFNYADKLSKGFPFVRADFYLINGKTIFGELTFTPGGCLDTGYLPEANMLLGEMISIK